MKHLLAACLLFLACQPAVSQVGPLRPRFVQVDTSTYDATRRYVGVADSLLKVRAARIAALEQQNKELAGQVENRAAEVLRERQQYAVLSASYDKLNARLQKTLDLPLEKPTLASPNFYKGALAGVLLYFSGRYLIPIIFKQP